MLVVNTNAYVLIVNQTESQMWSSREAGNLTKRPNAASSLGIN